MSWISWSLGLLTFAAGLQMIFVESEPNPWSGLRLSWTLADSEVWSAANRVAGFVIALYSLLFFLPLRSGPLMALLAAGAMVSGVSVALYARHLYQTKHGTTEVKKTGFLRYEPLDPPRPSQEISSRGPSEE